MKKSIRHQLVVELPDSLLRKLIHLRILDKWIENVINPKTCRVSNILTLIELIRHIRSDIACFNLFFFDSTPEGYDFWQSVQYEIEHWDKYHKK